MLVKADCEVAHVEPLSWVEICKRYPDEWVVLVDYSIDENEDVVAGRVLAHSAKKAEIKAAMAEPQDAAILYTGPVMPVAGWMARFDDDEV